MAQFQKKFRIVDHAHVVAFQLRLDAAGSFLIQRLTPHCQAKLITLIPEWSMGLVRDEGTEIALPAKARSD